MIQLEKNLNFIKKAILSVQLITDKNYRGISKFKKFILILAMIYVVSPIDFIPDLMIPIIGYVDDVVVLSIVFKMLNTELCKYSEYKAIR